MSVLAQLKPHHVREIRTLRDKGWSQARLATKYGVSQASIHNILVGKTYTSVV